ncbi:hypothetical protein DUNSADRAFT_17947 [Dunaliella salina]|uniref:Uncharacterized protein n=1 Tax=Dunaliella salina TaxID=3046 RepID=A0ABQ7H940_DUNSA|nr:hypothetical protein DUNSADRAFT_17947 [Dunaliella salina]|eukprot:KAF5843369.1 hypothetical protein DUNSADRAFT_17947 [Dunaliella salina]
MQAGSTEQDGAGAGGEQDQPNKLVVVPLYKVQDFAAVDKTEESVRSQESNVRSQLEHINQMVQQKHVYTSRFRRYKVDLKIPGQVDHSLLPADALPQIVSLLSERDFSQRITGTAVRHGCIILSLHMCQEMEQQQQQQQEEEATQAILAVAQTWLRKTHLADQVPHRTAITLQAGEVQYKLCWHASLHSWTVDGPQPVHEYKQFELRPLSHVAVLPQINREVSKRAGEDECVQAEGTTSGNSVQQQQQESSKRAGDHGRVQAEGTISGYCVQQQQQQQQEGKDAWDTVSSLPINEPQQCVLLAIPFSLHSRTSSHPILTGWTEDVSSDAFAAANPTADDQFMQQPTNTLSVLACVRGCYLPTLVEPMTEARACGKLTQEGSVGSERGAAARGANWQYKVLVSVPREVARCPYPQALHLELWRSWGMLHSCSSLLIPASLPNLAAEVRALTPQGLEADNLGVEPFLLDVADWLQQCLGQPSKLQQHQSHHHQLQQKLQHKQSEAGSEGGELWEPGCILARQAVLWGLPAMATLLVETLMALPHPTATPFTQLARAHRHSCSGSTAANGTAALGGLLHLALLSPCSTTMLWTVLDWGRHCGGEGDACTEGAEYAWDWGEPNTDGVTPQDLLEQQANRAAATAAVLQQQHHHQHQQQLLLQGEPAVECARVLPAEWQPEVKAPADASPTPRTPSTEEAASMPLAEILPSPPDPFDNLPPDPFDNLPTPFSSGVLPAPFSSSMLPTPFPSSVLLTPPPSTSSPSYLESPLMQASSRPRTPCNFDGMDQWKRALGCTQDHLTSTPTSSFQQLPVAGASACGRRSLDGACTAVDGMDDASGSQDHFSSTLTSSFQQLPAAGASACSRRSLEGSCVAADGVDNTSGTHAGSVLSSSGLGAWVSASSTTQAQTSPLNSLPSSAAKALDKRAASCEPCCSEDSPGSSVFTTPAATEAACPTECVHTHPYARVQATAECAVQERTATAASISALQGGWDIAAVREGCVSMGIPSDHTTRPAAVQQRPRQLSAPAAPPPTTSCAAKATPIQSQLQGQATAPPPTSSAAKATSTPSQLKGQVSTQADEQQLPTPASTQKTSCAQPPKRGCAWRLTRVLSPVSSAAPAAGDEQQLKQGGGCEDGEQHHQPYPHPHQHQQQQLELNAKSTPLQV